MVDTVSSEVRSRIMQAVPTRHSSPEIVVRKAAFALGHRFRLHRKDLPGSPDLVFPGKKKAIFVHGCFWHRHACPRGRSTPASRLDYWLPKFERNQARDKRVQRELKKLGWKSLVVWECQTRDPVKLAAKLAKFLDGGPRSFAKEPRMSDQRPAAPFDQKHAAEYDRRYAKVAPMRDALHLLIGAVFSGLPAEARILCVGAGTGAELIYLAQKFPGWRFTAVEPSAPMLDVCRLRTEETGVASRCTYHEGYLDTLPPAEPFDAATSLLVSQFVLAKESRRAFFRGIADRMRPGGLLATADLASDTNSAAYESLLEVWVRLMSQTEVPSEQLARMRETYRRDVAILPLDEVSELISTGGFETPVLFLQTGLIHGWYARKSGSAG